MKRIFEAQPPLVDKDMWEKEHTYNRILYRDTYRVIWERLQQKTIEILDADHELQGYIQDAFSGQASESRKERGIIFGTDRIVSQFYGARLGESRALPETAAKHIIIGSTTYFKHCPSIDCVGDVIRGVLQELYDLLDNEHPERKVEFALQPVDEKR